MRRRHVLAAVPAYALSLAAAPAPVQVLYAGSLVTCMERGIFPAVRRATGLAAQGYPGGSTALANQIKARLRPADVFISASHQADALLMGGPGAAVTWFITFARSPLLLLLAPRSPYAARFRTQPWYQVLATPGLRLGRTDPRLDPKGKLTVDLLHAAARRYGLPDLPERVLGADINPAQIRPEPELLGQLQAGQFDAGFFYATEAATLDLPRVALPPDIAQAALYTVTVLTGAPHPAEAARFTAFLLGPAGRRILAAHRFDLAPPVLTGEAASVPPPIRALLRLE